MVHFSGVTSLRRSPEDSSVRSLLPTGECFPPVKLFLYFPFSSIAACTWVLKYACFLFLQSVWLRDRGHVHSEHADPGCSADPLWMRHYGQDMPGSCGGTPSGFVSQCISKVQKSLAPFHSKATNTNHTLFLNKIVYSSPCI